MSKTVVKESSYLGEERRGTIWWDHQYFYNTSIHHVIFKIFCNISIEIVKGMAFILKYFKKHLQMP